MKNFKELRIWQMGFSIATTSFDLTRSFPKEERFGLSQQITNAAISIPSNIAEGSSRRSAKDYHRFIEISLGSSFELETQLLIADAVDFGKKEILHPLLKSVLDEQRMLSGFLSKLQ